MLQISRRFVCSAKDASTCSREESFRWLSKVAEEDEHVQHVQRGDLLAPRDGS